MPAVPPAPGPGPTRLPTGVPGLDALLGGGLLRGGLYLVDGQPGAGKTILGNQLCFAHAAAGGRALFLSVLTEPHARMLGHLRTLAFYDEAVVGDAVYYLSGFETLEAGGFAALLPFLGQAVRERQATLLVIDGLATAADMAATDLDLRRFLRALQLLLETLGGTVVLLARVGTGPSDVAHTGVDGVVELREERVGAVVARTAEITKSRGGPHLRGRHEYAIGDAGLTFYPRTEALYAAPPPGSVPTGPPLPLGIAALDAMLGGGVRPGTTTLVLGAPGTGKTLLGLHFLTAGLAAGEDGRFLGFHEPPPLLVARGDRLGLGLGDAVAAGHIALLWQPPLEQGLDATAAQLLAAVDHVGVRRLVIDGLGGLAGATHDPARFARFWAALVGELRGRSVTTLATLELPEFYGPAAAVPLPGVAEQTDAILFLRGVELHSQLHRLLTILKVRDGAFDRAIRVFHIGARGIDVAESFASAEAILTGLARGTVALTSGDAAAAP